MKEFQGLVLCDERTPRVDIHIRADLIDGRLLFSGQDLGPFVEETWGDEDYEYYYMFDEENTVKLLEAIKGTDDPEEAVCREFNGSDGCIKLRGICEENGIQYKFHSYV